jgi:hypothetical protein
MIGTLLDVTGNSVAEPCRSDTVKVQVPTYYFPSYDSGSGSLHKFKRKFFFLFRFILKLYGNRLILTQNCLFCSPSLILLKTNLSNPYLQLFHTRNTYGKITVPVLTVEKWYGSSSGSGLAPQHWPEHGWIWPEHTGTGYDWNIPGHYRPG